MQKLIFPFFALFFLIAGTGCTTKFKIAAPYENITVIYGFLDMNDTAHYIRVQKAFLDNSKSALTMSQSPDSSFYANINVRINRIDVTDSLLHDTIHLNRVDLNLEGYPKQPGVFFTAPNYAYKFKNVLDHNYIYRIVVKNQTTGQVDSADAPIIDDSPNSNDPNTGMPYLNSPIFSDTDKLAFESTLPNKYVDIQGTFTDNFYYEGQPTAAIVSDLVIQFNWIDSNYVTHSNTAHSYSFDLGYQSLLGNNVGQIDYQIANYQLYTALHSGMNQAPLNTIRLIDKTNIYIYLGTLDYYNYYQNSLVQGTGLTGSEIEPIYTNVKGLSALGLFTSRGVRMGIVEISPFTVDSLRISPLMAGCNIQGTTY